VGRAGRGCGAGMAWTSGGESEREVEERGEGGWEARCVCVCVCACVCVCGGRVWMWCGELPYTHTFTSRSTLGVASCEVTTPMQRPPPPGGAQHPPTRSTSSHLARAAPAVHPAAASAWALVGQPSPTTPFGTGGSVLARAVHAPAAASARPSTAAFGIFGSIEVNMWLEGIPFRFGGVRGVGGDERRPRPGRAEMLDCPGHACLHVTEATTSRGRPRRNP